ncbi:MAG: hypothetical protein QXK76_00055 [Candidatus Woesearchaeota archaeon]
MQRKTRKRKQKKLINIIIIIAIIIAIPLIFIISKNLILEKDLQENIEQKNNVYEKNQLYEDTIDLVKTCYSLGGIWIDNYDECEGISKEECEYLDGKFEECASACRHTKTEICTMQCISVCSFE